MDVGLTLIINLAGQIGPPLKHTTKQVFSANVSKTTKPEILIRKIKHTNRGTLPATRVMKISPAVVYSWKFGECPYWSDPKIWKKLSAKQRVEMHASRFDEGYGVSFE